MADAGSLEGELAEDVDDPAGDVCEADPPTLPVLCCRRWEPAGELDSTMPRTVDDRSNTPE